MSVFGSDPQSGSQIDRIFVGHDLCVVPYGKKYRSNSFNLKSAVRISSAIIAVGDAYHPREALHMITRGARASLLSLFCLSLFQKAKSAE